MASMAERPFVSTAGVSPFASTAGGCSAFASMAGARRSTQLSSPLQFAIGECGGEEEDEQVEDAEAGAGV